MKQLFLAIITLMPVCAMAQQPKASFTIKGTIRKELQPGTFVYLIAENRDSVPVINNRFTLTTAISEPRIAAFVVKTPDNNPLYKSVRDIFIEPGVMTVTMNDSLATAKISGSSQKDWELFQEIEKIILDSMTFASQQMGSSRKRGDKDSLEYYSKEFKRFSDRRFDASIAFADKHPDSYVSGYLLNFTAINRPDYETLHPVYAGFSKRVKSSPTGMHLEKRINGSRLKTGVIAPDFTLKDTDNKAVSLYSYKGKYVFIDFWASWCAPCRAESPNIAKAYQLYKDKGFEVLGLSIDDNKQDWLKAVTDDKLPWVNVLDSKDPQQDVQNTYAITGLPRNFLLDREGRIIAKDLRGDAVNKKLEEIFSKE